MSLHDTDLPFDIDSWLQTVSLWETANIFEKFEWLPKEEEISFFLSNIKINEKIRNKLDGISKKKYRKRL